MRSHTEAEECMCSQGKLTRFTAKLDAVGNGRKMSVVFLAQQRRNVTEEEECLNVQSGEGI